MAEITREVMIEVRSEAQVDTSDQAPIGQDLMEASVFTSELDSSEERRAAPVNQAMRSHRKLHQLFVPLTRHPSHDPERSRSRHR